MIFISYRITDAVDLVGRLESDLTREFGRESVFRDMTRLVPGRNWTDQLIENARNCKVMLAVIGATWDSTAASEGDQKHFPRLSDPDDWVRKEISLALDAGRMILPVFLNGASMPKQAWLRRCGLEALYEKQGVPLRTVDYTADFRRLVDQLRPILGTNGAADPGYRSHCQATFLHSIISSKEFAEIGFLFNPYSEYLDPTDPPDFGKVTVYLWLPEPSYFKNTLVDDTCIVAVCDAGMLEIEKKVGHLDLDFLSQCYPFSPRKLNIGKAERLVSMIGNVMKGTFILGAVVPKLLLGAGLRDAGVSYQSILNTVLFPLVVAHSKIGFTNFGLVLSEVRAYEKSVAALSKRIIKSAYSEKRFEVAPVQRGDTDYFYIYAARFISWAVGRHYSFGDDEWLHKLDVAFRGNVDEGMCH